jgi:hypothetical protein
MIQTFEVVPTAANARRMVRLATIMNVSIDPVINDLAQLDMFDVEKFITDLPDNLKKYATLPRCEWIQHAHDWDYRCIVGSTGQTETYSAMFMAAIASEARPIVFLAQDDHDRVRSIVNFLRDREVDFQMIDQNFNGIEKDVIVVRNDKLTHNVLREARKGILIHQVLDTQSFQNNMFTSDNFLEYLALEFPKCIFGITTNQMIRANGSAFVFGEPNRRAFSWWESRNFQNAFAALFPSSPMSKIFNTDHSGTDNNLLRLGFILRSPEHFAKVTNVYMDLLKVQME